MRRIIIIGAQGTGKSTLVDYFADDLAVEDDFDPNAEDAIDLLAAADIVLSGVALVQWPAKLRAIADRSNVIHLVGGDLK